jgi:5-methylcytosine-specific restriction endonuclease McrA
MTYQMYLETPEWKRHVKETHARARADRNGECATCHRRGTEVHHRTYARLGHEDPADLVLLCAKCHRRLHGTFDEAIEAQLTLPLAA